MTKAQVKVVIVLVPVARLKESSLSREAVAKGSELLARGAGLRPGALLVGTLLVMSECSVRNINAGEDCATCCP